MIDEAIQAGARQHKACGVIEISPRTLQNWRKKPGEGDLRRGPKHPPAHKITAQEQGSERVSAGVFSDEIEDRARLTLRDLP